MPDLTISFPTQESLDAFRGWFCVSGEQEYWMWMEERESELDSEDEVITCFFNYWQPTFKDNKIKATLLPRDEVQR